MVLKHPLHIGNPSFLAHAKNNETISLLVFCFKLFSRHLAIVGLFRSKKRCLNVTAQSLRLIESLLLTS